VYIHGHKELSYIPRSLQNIVTSIVIRHEFYTHAHIRTSEGNKYYLSVLLVPSSAYNRQGFIHQRRQLLPVRPAWAALGLLKMHAKSRAVGVLMQCNSNNRSIIT
jgi:hypothetical protein